MPNTKRDRSQVAGEQAAEVNYLAKKLGTSPAKIHEAIAAVGHNREKITAWIKKWQASR